MGLEIMECFALYKMVILSHCAAGGRSKHGMLTCVGQSLTTILFGELLALEEPKQSNCCHIQISTAASTNQARYLVGVGVEC
jgi:hypothetical protein